MPVPLVGEPHQFPPGESEGQITPNPSSSYNPIIPALSGWYQDRELLHICVCVDGQSGHPTGQGAHFVVLAVDEDVVGWGPVRI